MVLTALLKECGMLPSSLSHFLGQCLWRVGRRRREDGGHRVLVLLHELRVTPETDALLMFIALNFRSGAPEAKTSLDLIMEFVELGVEEVIERRTGFLCIWGWGALARSGINNAI